MADQQQVHVIAQPDSRLEALLAEYANARPAADAAAERLKAVTDSIKAELKVAQPNARSIVVTSQVEVPLTLSYVESWRLDSRRLKVEAPETYVRYARKSGSWQLRRAGS